MAVLGLCPVASTIPAVVEANPDRPDTRGLLLVGGAMAAFVFGLEMVGRGVVPAGLAEAGLILGVLIGMFAMRHCLRAERPALDFSLLQVPAYHAAAVSGTVFGAGASPFLVHGLMQVNFGWSATESGLVHFATAIGALAMKPLAYPILRRWGFRGAVVWGRAAGRRDAGGLRAVHRSLAAAGDVPGAGRRRALPQPAIHRVEHAGSRRSAAIALLGGHRFLRHPAADRAGAGGGVNYGVAGSQRGAGQAGDSGVGFRCGPRHGRASGVQRADVFRPPAAPMRATRSAATAIGEAGRKATTPGAVR